MATSACTLCTCPGFENTHGEWCTCGHGPNVHRRVKARPIALALGPFASLAHKRILYRNETKAPLSVHAELENGRLVIVIRETN